MDIHLSRLRVTLFLALSVFFLVGSLFNAFYGFSVGSGSLVVAGYDVGGYAMAAASIAAELVSYGSAIALGLALSTRKFMAALYSFLALTIALGWSLFASAGALSHVQSEAASRQAVASPAYLAARAEYDSAMTTISAASKRALSQIEADLNAIRMTAVPGKPKLVGEYLECGGGDKVGDVSRQWCGKVLELETELRSIDAAEAAQVKAVSAQSKMSAASQAADGQSNSIVALASIVGLHISGDTARDAVNINRLLMFHLVPVLVSLMIGALSGEQKQGVNQAVDRVSIDRVSMGVSEVCQMAQTRPFDTLDTLPVDRVSIERVDRVSIAPPDRSSPTVERLTNHLLSVHVGGPMLLTFSDLKDAVGASRNTIKAALESLEEAGALTWQSGPRGVTITLLNQYSQSTA